MYKAVEKFFLKHPQVQKNQRFLLAVSGGLDSTVLAEVFHYFKLNFSIAHCNFHLRGEDSNRDENFVKKLAEKYQAPLFIKEFETDKVAKAQKIGIEEAARKLRYDWFQEILFNEKFDWLATAHHLDDSIETVLFNLMRGSGISGLHGILSVRNQIIRPLIGVTRDEIEIFAKKHQISYCEDYTNSDTQYSRNKIRHELIPVLKEIQPNFAEIMDKTTTRLQGVEKIYKEAVQQICNEVVIVLQNQIIIDIEKILQTASPITILFEILNTFGFYSVTIQDIFNSLKGESGKVFYSDKFQAIKDRKTLIICKKFSENDKIFTIERSQTKIDTPIKLNIQYQDVDNDFKIDKSSYIAYFDAEKLKYPLKLRHWKPGDYFVPFGIKGRKKLSYYFSDQKFSLIDKQNVWLLCSGIDVIWIVGHRTDERYRIEKKNKIGSDIKDSLKNNNLVLTNCK